MINVEQYHKSHLSFLLTGLVSLRAQAEDGFPVPDGSQPFTADSSVGICANVHDFISQAVLPDDILEMPAHEGGSRDSVEENFDQLKVELFNTWPDFSGCSYYPVPGDGWYEDRGAGSWAGDREDDAGYAFEHTEDYWEGRYGEHRMELLNHMIDRLTEALVVEEPVAVPETTGVTTYGSPAGFHNPSHGGYPG